MRTGPRVVVPLAVLTAVLTVSALVTGCSGDDEPTPPAAGASTPAASSTVAGGEETEAPPTEPAGGSDGGTDAPPFPANTSPDTAEQSPDARVTVRDIRIGRHDGFDRVVFEVGGTGTPGWDVRYVDEAASQGSGDPVDVEGEAVLQVTLTGAGYPYDTGVTEYSGPDPLSVAATEVVTEVAFDATFEGTTVAFVGTTARTPFRVHLLENPARVVLEVADPG